MQRAIIIDDEQAGIETIKLLAARIPKLVKIVAATTDPAQGLLLVEDYRPDILFLDVSMPGMNGFELLNRLSWRQFRLVFTTAHREYAINAIKQQAFDYLLKPIDEQEFRSCIEKIQTSSGMPVQEVKNGPQNILAVPVKDGILYLPQQEIIRLEASRSYTIFYMEARAKHLASGSMGEFESRLNEQYFFRCHHSHIINLGKVRKFINHDGCYALMSDGTQVDISKKHRDTFLDRLNGL